MLVSGKKCNLNRISFSELLRCAKASMNLSSRVTAANVEKYIHTHTTIAVYYIEMHKKLICARIHVRVCMYIRIDERRSNCCDNGLLYCQNQ